MFEQTFEESKMKESMVHKLEILAASAKFDVSCASSGVDRYGEGRIGNSKACGICHAWSSDGRCISLLKVLHSNCCVFDCAYCVNRRSNDIPRASFTSEELAELTIEFYRRNYIEGLFLSSAVEKNPTETMERIVRTLWLLRKKYGFAGYIHAKLVPGADPLLVHRAGELADRVSVNVELPSAAGLAALAPQKKPELLIAPMRQVYQEIGGYLEDKRHYRHTPAFAPGGQSTQMIVGAIPDTDYQLLQASSKLYRGYGLKRVYYSAYIPVNEDRRLPALSVPPPKDREHRLYQADWLMRFYEFEADELLDPSQPFFDTEWDPKMDWALKHIELFPIEINQASYHDLLRVPGIGPTSARRILAQRRLAPLTCDTLSRTGVVMKRARYFLTCTGRFCGDVSMHPENIKNKLRKAERQGQYTQLTLF